MAHHRALLAITSLFAATSSSSLCETAVGSPCDVKINYCEGICIMGCNPWETLWMSKWKCKTCDQEGYVPMWTDAGDSSSGYHCVEAVKATKIDVGPINAIGECDGYRYRTGTRCYKWECENGHDPEESGLCHGEDCDRFCPVATDADPSDCGTGSTLIKEWKWTTKPYRSWPNHYCVRETKPTTGPMTPQFRKYPTGCEKEKYEDDKYDKARKEKNKNIETCWKSSHSYKDEDACMRMPQWRVCCEDPSYKAKRDRTLNDCGQRVCFKEDAETDKDKIRGVPGLCKQSKNGVDTFISI